MNVYRLSSALITLSILGSAAMAGCGSTSTAKSDQSAAKGCKNVGVLLPDSASSDRWEGKDHPLLDASLKKAIPGVKLEITNANGNSDTQISQAQADLTQGACILIVAAVDSAKAAEIVQLAKKDYVPVIAYDRLIQDSALDYYVSFDNVAVGKAQGQYIADHYQQYVSSGHNNIVLINGSPTDNNATLFKQGAHDILDPLISNKTLNSVYEISTPAWDNPTAETEMEGALTAQSDNIQIAYVANDGMASTVIAALTAHHLNGKVLVTGQDATVAGIQNIVLGNQSMTVYKPIVNEANGATELAAALSEGKNPLTLANHTIANTGANTPSVILPVESVDASNINQTVIKDGYVTKAEICAATDVAQNSFCQ